MLNFIRAYESHERLIDDIDGLTNARDYQQLKSVLVKIQNACSLKWSTFNLKFCILGLLSLACSIFNLGVNFDTKISFKFVLFSICMYSILSFLTLNFQNIWIYTSLINIYFLFKKLNNLSFIKKQVNIENFILILSFIIPFSNSYIIKENNSIRFLLITFLFYRIYLSLRKKLSILKFFICITLIRVSHVFYVCREEALNTCSQTIFALPMLKSSLTTFTYTLFYSFNFFFVFLAFLVLRPKSLRLNLFLSASLLTLLVYSYVQIFSKDSTGTKYPQLLLARLFLILFGCQQIFAWSSVKSKPEKFSFTYLSIVLFISLLLGESLLSVWILAVILHLGPDRMAFNN